MKAIIKKYDNRIEIWKEVSLNEFKKYLVQYYPEVGWTIPREIYDYYECSEEDNRLIKP